MSEGVFTNLMSSSRLQLLPLDPIHVKVLLREGSKAFTTVSGMEVAKGIRDFFFMAPEAYRASIEQATAADVWAFGFAAVLLEPRLWIGSAGYKGAPDTAGMVEIAYGVAQNTKAEATPPKLQRRSWNTLSSKPKFVSLALTLCRSATPPAECLKNAASSSSAPSPIPRMASCGVGKGLVPKVVEHVGTTHASMKLE